MNNVAHIETRFDGAIPPNLLTAAKAQDKAEAKTRRSPSARIRASSVRAKPAFVAERMARVATKAIDETGELSDRRLLAAGFTQAEITRHGPAAVAAARAAIPARHWEAVA